MHVDLYVRPPMPRAHAQGHVRPHPAKTFYYTGDTFVFANVRPVGPDVRESPPETFWHWLGGLFR